MVAVVLPRDPHFVRPHIREQDIIFAHNLPNVVEHLLGFRRKTVVPIVAGMVSHHHLANA